MTGFRKLTSVLMIVENYYPMDIRVQREAVSLSKKYSITILAIKQKGAPFFDIVDGIRVFRCPPLPQLRPRKIGYFLEYLYLTLISCLFFLITLPIYRYKVVHAHNPPDTLVIVGILAKLLGRKYVFDHHDLAPELYLTRFSSREDIYFRTLLGLEKLSCIYADVVITANRSYKDHATNTHGIRSDKVHIVRNNPLPGEFEKTPSLKVSRDNDSISIIFVGSINPQDGVLDLLDVFEKLLNRKLQRDVRLLIIGGGDSLEEVKDRAIEKGLLDHVIFTGMIHDRNKIIDLLCSSDIGVEPAPENPLNTQSTFIKVMEYMASGLPVVAYDLPETRYSLDDTGILVEPGNQDQFAHTLFQLIADDDLRRKLGDAGRQRISTRLNWEQSRTSLMKAYSSILD